MSELEPKNTKPVSDTDTDADTDTELEPEPIGQTFTYAIVRLPAPTCAEGLTTSNLGRPDYITLLQQHLSYSAVLRALGLKIIKLPSLPEYPDSHFVEDVAVVTQEIAVITRPGAEQRRGETEHIREILAQYRPLAFIEEPGTLDGGDVMQIEQTVYIGLSERTNEAGAAQLANILEQYGYEVHTAPLVHGLHLKSDVNYIGRNTLIVNEAWADYPLFSAYEKVIVPPDEALVTNTLLVNGRLLTPLGYPQTHTYLRELEFDLLEISASEAQKMDGGLSCMSLRF